MWVTMFFRLVLVVLCRGLVLGLLVWFWECRLGFRVELGFGVSGSGGLVEESL